MIVVLDTNVVISGILTSRGPTRRIVDQWADGTFTVAVSPALIEEYIGVLLRPKFNAIGSADIRTQIVASFLNLPNTVTVLPQRVLNVVVDDPSDNYVLACAEASRAKYIVSGDHHLLNLGAFGTISILRPADFLNKLRTG